MVKVLNHILFFFWKQLCLPIVLRINRIDGIVAPDFVVPIFSGGVKKFPVIHDTFFWELKENYNPVWLPYFLYSIEKPLNSDTTIITTSKFSKERIKQKIKNTSKIEVLYQCAKPLKKVNSDDRLHVLGKFNVVKPYFLHVGVLDKRKNLSILIQAFRKFRDSRQQDIQLVLVGSRGLSYKHDDYSNIVKLIKELDIENDVIITGFANELELSVFYQNAKAYIFPSIMEGFGIPILEAMQAGIPLIVSDKGPLPEIAGEAALIFKHNSELDLYDKMNAIIQEDTRQKLITSGNHRYKRFSRKVFAEGLDLIIKKHFIEGPTNT
jgi:glycosyltransferase involved in cell wall biosynthesis